MKKVSVVIPVYNAEKHLRQCLDTVVSQTLEDIEIICVDDGSTDSSLEILKEYQKKDERFRYYTQKNQYAGIARNLGKSHATGEYLVFWDSDDFFELDALECLYNRAVETDADICICGANRYFEDTEKIVPHVGYLKMNKLPDAETFNQETNAFIYNFTTAVPWNKIFKRSFVEKEQLEFQGVRNGNDIYFVSTAMGLADRISVVDKKLINYRVNAGSSLVDTLSKSPLTPLKAWAAVAEELKKRNRFPEQSFVNRMLGSGVLSILQKVNSWEAFCNIMDYLQEEGLEKLCLQEEHPQEYYYTDWHKVFADKLRKGEREDLATFLLAQASQRGDKLSGDLTRSKQLQKKWKQEAKDLKQELTTQKQSLKELKKEQKKTEATIRLLKNQQKEFEKKIRALEKENTQIKESTSYKIGKTITWLPGKIKNLKK